MTRASVPSNTGKKISNALFCSIFSTLLLFFADEDIYYRLWFNQAGKYFIFLLYLWAFGVGQVLTYFLMLSYYKGENKLALANLIGIPLGFGFILLLYYTAWVLYA